MRSPALLLLLALGCSTDRAPRPSGIDSTADTLVTGELPDTTALDSLLDSLPVQSVDTVIQPPWVDTSTVIRPEIVIPPETTVVIDTTRPADTTVVVVVRDSAIYRGIGIGAYVEAPVFLAGLPSPLSLGVGGTTPERFPAELALAKQKRQRRAVFFPDGSHAGLMTAGKFDVTKWRARVRKFDTAPIRAAVAQAVLDGTLIAHYLVDEPSNKDWGGVFGGRTLQGASRRGISLLDTMAATSKSIFPTLPTAVVVTCRYLVADSLQPFQHVDAIATQYDHWQGEITGWRDKCEAVGRRMNVALLYQMNVIDGGVQNAQQTCPAPLTGGPGGTRPLGKTCRLSAAQLRDWGRVLSTGCGLVLWKLDAMLAKPDYVAALKDLRAVAAGRPTTPCRRR